MHLCVRKCASPWLPSSIKSRSTFERRNVSPSQLRCHQLRQGGSVRTLLKTLQLDLSHAQPADQGLRDRVDEARCAVGQPRRRFATSAECGTWSEAELEAAIRLTDRGRARSASSASAGRKRPPAIAFACSAVAPKVHTHWDTSSCLADPPFGSEIMNSLPRVPSPW